MRKFKRIVPFIVAVCLVFSLCFSLACKTDSNELQSIALDTTNAKVDYSLGEEYRSTGLVVTANYKSGNSETIDLANVSIDAGAYDAYTLGTYDIKVSYTSEEVTAEATYQVNVVNALFGGLVVTLKSGRQQKYELSQSMKTVSFTYAATWIEVRKPDANGEVDMNSEPLSMDSYTVKVYKNGIEVTELGALKRGHYQLVATMYDEKEDFTYEGFTFVTLFDDVQSIAFKDGTTSQPKGLRETMTQTWQFTVTYNSGDTEVVDRTNPYLSISAINPNVAAGGGTATVTYGEPKLLSAPATNVRTIEVPYTLTGDQKNPELAILNFISYEKDFVITNETVKYNNFEFDIIGGKITDKGALIALPTGIVVNGQEKVNVGMAYLSGGASSATNGRYINFSANKEFEIYIYAKANSDSERCMFLETESDYATINFIDGYVGGGDQKVQIQPINGVPTATGNDAYSVHAVSVTGISAENPADFSISFDDSIRVLYVLLIFPEEAK